MMKKNAFCVLAAIVLCLTLLLNIGAAMAETNVTRIRVNDEGVSLRSSPMKTDYNKIASVHAGTYLDVYDEVNGWYYVCYWGQWGYVSSNARLVTVVGRSNNGSSSYENSSPYSEGTVTRIMTNSEGASLRSTPMVTDYNKIDGIHAFTYLDVYDVVDGWYYVCYQGQWGYVNSDPQFVSIVSTDQGAYGNQNGPSTSSVSRIRTNSEGASLRSTPMVTDYNKIDGIHAFTYLDVYGEENGWYYVYYQGQWGYVNSSPQFVTVVN